MPKMTRDAVPPQGEGDDFGLCDDKPVARRVVQGSLFHCNTTSCPDHFPAKRRVLPLIKGVYFLAPNIFLIDLNREFGFG